MESATAPTTPNSANDGSTDGSCLGASACRSRSAFVKPSTIAAAVPFDVCCMVVVVVVVVVVVALVVAAGSVA